MDMKKTLFCFARSTFQKSFYYNLCSIIDFKYLEISMDVKKKD